ncbi:MAG TPA: hypothetical protein VM842_10055 [Nitrospira sp.]|nr:hypothetical protein [Nitrospira sp.]
MENHKTGSTATEAPTVGQDLAKDPMAVVDQVARQTGERLKSAADQLRARAPKDGLAGQVADSVTSGVKQAATHLQEQGFGGFVDDLVAIAKRHPVPMLILGIGGAFLFSRLRRD